MNEGRNRNQPQPRRQVTIESNEPKAMIAIDGAGFDWHQMAQEQSEENIGLIAVEEDTREDDAVTGEESTNMALMAFSDTEVYLENQTCSKKCQKINEGLESRCNKLIDNLFDKTF